MWISNLAPKEMEVFTTDIVVPIYDCSCIEDSIMISEVVYYVYS